MAVFGQRRPLHLATNAPRHWPRVPASAWVRGKGGLNDAIVAGIVLEGLEEAGHRPSLDAFSSLLYADGVLRVPAVIGEPSGRTALFTYPQGGPLAAAHYAGVRALLRQREQMAAVYFAPEPLSPAPPAAVLEELDTFHFRRDDAGHGPAEYALWWPTPEDPRLAASPALAALDAWFEALDGHVTGLFSAFVAELQLADAAPGQLFAPPVEPLLQPVEGPGGLRLMLDASEAEGLWLAFDVAGTRAERRNVLIGHLASMARRFRSAAAAPPRGEEHRIALEAWRAARDEALRLERRGAPDVRVGALRAGQAPRRLLVATSAADRAAAPPAAEDALLDFARQQLAEAFRQVEGRVAGHAAGGPDGPNLQPFVAVREGGATWRTTLAFYDEPQAVEAAPRVVAEHPDAELAAVACDSILNLDGERTDAIVVRVQGREEAGSQHFAQRYRLAAGRLELLGNWLLVGDDAPLYGLVREPPSVGPPSDALRGFVEECLQQTVRFMGLGDMAEWYQEDEPLFSPSLLVRSGGQTREQRFEAGNVAWAEESARQSVAGDAAASMAVFLYDMAITREGEPAREWRFVAHERGEPSAFHYRQRYEAPRPGEPFRTMGTLELVGAADPILPAVAAPPSADAERRRVDMSRGTEGISIVQRGLAGRVTAARREANLIDHFRFSAARCELDGQGLRAWAPNGSCRTVAWSELGEAWTRRLPSHPPYDSALLVDLVPVGPAGEPLPPIRILPATIMNFRALPGTPSTARSENLKRVVQLARQHQPALALDEETYAWAYGALDARSLGSMAPFMEHDARFG